MNHEELKLNVYLPEETSYMHQDKLDKRKQYM